jgi:hypothetical protein
MPSDFEALPFLRKVAMGIGHQRSRSHARLPMAFRMVFANPAGVGAKDAIHAFNSASASRRLPPPSLK